MIIINDQLWNFQASSQINAVSKIANSLGRAKLAKQHPAKANCSIDVTV